MIPGMKAAALARCVEQPLNPLVQLMWSASARIFASRASSVRVPAIALIQRSAGVQQSGVAAEIYRLGWSDLSRGDRVNSPRRPTDRVESVSFGGRENCRRKGPIRLFVLDF